MSWIHQHANTISALASVGILLIWTIYSWLFFRAFRRHRSSQLFIHQAGGEALQATCVLVNLSSEPVHVIRVLASSDGGTVRLRDSASTENLTVFQRELEGPLSTGESMNLGSFEDICGHLGLPVGSDDSELLVEIRVAALHGFRRWPVGARRTFQVDRSGNRAIPQKHWTEQLHDKRHAAEIQRWIGAR